MPIPDLTDEARLRHGIPETEEEGSDFVGLLFRRGKVIGAVAALIFILVAVGTLLQSKRYESQTKLEVITKGGGDMGSSGPGGDIIGALGKLEEGRSTETQAEIIDNPDLLEAAMYQLTPTERKKAFHRLEDPTQPPDWAFDVKAKEDTDIIDVTGRAYDPKLAAKFANAIVREYLAEDLRNNSKATRQAEEYVHEQLKNSQKELEDATLELSKYAKRTGLISQEDQISAIAQSQEELQIQAAASDSEVAASKQRLEYLRKALASTSGSIPFEATISQNPEYGLVQQQIVQLEGQIAEQSQEFTPSSQTIQGLKSQLTKLQNQLKGLVENTPTSTTSQVNPVRLKLLDDFADAKSAELVAEAHSSALKTQLGRIQNKVAQLPDQERGLALLQGRVEVLNRTFSLLSDRYYSLLIDEQSSIANGLQAGLARPPLRPSSPKVILNLIAGLFVGLALGYSFAAVIEKFDTKINLPEDAERISSLPTLGYIPESTSTGRDLVIGVAEPTQAFAEAFRILRNNLNFARVDDPPRTIAVTSASMSEGKSTVCLNIALAEAMNGLKVVLVDVDLHRPNVHKLLGLGTSVGLTSAIRGNYQLSDIIQKGPHENLSIITAGPLPPDPTELLESKAAKSVFNELLDKFDMVLLDAPPSAGLSDVQVIGRLADSVLFVVSLNSTKKPALRAALRMLRLSNAPLLGLVINRLKQRGGYYYGYYYGYGEYGEKETSSKKESVLR
jgi:succinoglycan biosynthesis transport protein ExoP